MVYLLMWLVATFAGLAWELYRIGKAQMDRTWFARLGFSDAAQDVAYSHFLHACGNAGVMFAWFIIGIFVMITSPPSNQPTTPARILTTMLLTGGVLSLTIMSFYLDRRRTKLSKQEWARTS